MSDLFVNAEQAASILGVKESTVYTFAARGLIDREWRHDGKRERWMFSVADLQRYNAEKRSVGKPRKDASNE